MLRMFKGGVGEANQKGDRQRETNNQVTHQLVYSDTLRIRTKNDCNATPLCIYFMYLRKCIRNCLNTNRNGILYK